MAHHKRRRPKNTRSGCLLCKPWKANGVSIESKDGESFSAHVKRISMKKEMKYLQFVDLERELDKIN